MNALTKHTSIFGAMTLLAATAFAAPAMASSTSHSRAATAKTAITSGIVISKDVRRHTLVVTTPSGVVKTVRLASSVLSKARVGEKVTSRTTRLADGTYTAAVITSVGHATRAKIRATIVSSHSGKLLLSAGGSVFGVATGRSAHDQSTSTVTTGQTVDVSVGIEANGLDQISEQSTGQSNLIGLDGVLTAVSSSSLTIAVEDGASTTVAIPAALTVPSTIAVGDRIEILVDYTNQTFTLVTIKDDSLASNDQGQGISEGDNQNLQVEGQVVAVSAASISIQPGDEAAAVTFSVPSTLDVSSVMVGDQADAEGLVVAGVLTLTSIDAQQSDSQDQGDQATSQVTGTVTVLSATSVGVVLTGSSVVITAAIPSTFDASELVLGATVRLTTEVLAGVLTVTEVEVPDAYSLDVSGTVVSISATTLIVLSSDTNLPVTFTIPATLHLPAVTAGLTITAHGDLVAGGAVLTSLELAN
jgi:hypothetical protein